MIERIDHQITLTDLKEKISTGNLLLVFSASWCAPCRNMQPFIEEISAGFRVVELNVDNNVPVCSFYNIFNVPTIILVKDGVMQRTLTGYQSKRTLAYFIQGAH